MKFIPLTEALRGWFATPFDELPRDVQQRIEHDFLPMPWDTLDEEGRRSIAAQWDYQHDPATEDERTHYWNLWCDIDDLNRRIAEVERLETKTYEGRRSKVRQLAAMEKKRQELLLKFDEGTEQPSDSDEPTGSDDSPPSEVSDLECLDGILADEASHPSVTMWLEGRTWMIELEGRQVPVASTTGMHYLSKLIAHPGKDFPFFDLFRELNATPTEIAGRDSDDLRSSIEQESIDSEEPSGFGLQSDLGFTMDKRMENEIKRKLKDLDEEIADLIELGESAAAKELKENRKAIDHELQKRIGKSGKARIMGGLDDRFRPRISMALKRAYAEIERPFPELAEYLRQSVRCRNGCYSYRPTGTYQLTKAV